MGYSKAKVDPIYDIHGKIIDHVKITLGSEASFVNKHEYLVSHQDYASKKGSINAQYDCSFVLTINLYH
jgi:hypothetical protein